MKRRRTPDELHILTELATVLRIIAREHPGACDILTDMAMNYEAQTGRLNAPVTVGRRAALA